MTLAQAKFSNELYQKIDDLLRNQSGIVEDLIANLRYPLAKVAILDEFEQLSVCLSVKICWGLTLVSEFLVSNVLFILFILYDKYGEDSMKRPLYNQLSSQTVYPGLISSLISTPAWAWRIYIGPLNSTAADFVVFVNNTCTIWALICLTQALLMRALLVTNYKYVGSINDTFVSNYIFMVNFGITCISHIGLFLLGSLGSDDLLTGIMRKDRLPVSLFYLITIGVLSATSCVSIIVIAVKKFVTYRKDSQLVNECRARGPGLLV